MEIIPVILCGGSGTRLWPVSRTSRPKQFLKFGTQYSLFQQTLLRCQHPIFSSRPIIVATDEHRFLVAEQLRELDIKADILLEPVPKNSCAAIVAGVLQAKTRPNHEMILVLAADHHIPDEEAFTQAVKIAVPDAAKDYLVTFGIQPTSPATGFGYIAPGEPIGEVFKCAQFVEKPDKVRAETLIAKGCLWNSGNFLFHPKILLTELEKFAPQLKVQTISAFEQARQDLDFIRLDEHVYEKLPDMQFDHAVMEKTDRAAILPVDYSWHDVGSWEALAALAASDDHENQHLGEARFLNAHRNLVHSEHMLTSLVDVDGLVVVATKDCVLVAARDSAENVKQLVHELSQEDVPQLHEAPQMFRPWGNYERLDMCDDYQVKRIIVKPGAALSLQKHQYRAEHWVVVSGRALVTIKDQQLELGPTDSVNIPAGTVHRLANPFEHDLILIEIQTGTYLGEDDIVRIDDHYSRHPIDEE